MNKLQHPYAMGNELLGIPQVVEKCLQGDISKNAVSVGTEIASRNITRAILTGCGTSMFAAMAVQYAITELAGLDADCYDAFEFEKYMLKKPIGNNVVFLAFSHSGTTVAAYKSMEAIAKTNAYTVAFTEAIDSRLAKSAQAILCEGSGIEKPEPKTRSYISSIIMGYQVAASIKKDTPAMNELKRIPSLLEKIMEMEPSIHNLSEECLDYNRILIVGGGPNTATAYELALKMKEVLCLPAEGMQVEEALHGPQASIKDNTLVIGISSQGESYDKVGYMMKIASVLGAKVLVFTDKPYPIEDITTVKVPLDGIREIFGNAVLIYPLYFFNYRLALKKGIDPDQIRSGDPLFKKAMAAVPDTHDPGI